MRRHFASLFTALILPLAAVVQAQAGTLDHFTFDTVPTSAVAGTPFATQITARDSGGNAVTTFSGSVNVTATSALSPVVITEVQLTSPHQAEIQNVSNSTVNTTGWFLAFSSGTSSVNTTNANYFYLTTGSSTKQTTQTSTLTAGQMQVVNDSAPPSGDFNAITWPTSTRKGWIALFDSTSTLRDFFVWGWTASDLAGFSLTVNGNTITLGNQWSGDGFSGSTSTSSYSMQRTGSADSNTAADWNWVTPTSFGTSTPGSSKPASTYTSSGTNTGLTLPFAGTSFTSAGAVSLSVTPPSVTFVNGVFSGNLTIASASTLVTMTANDGAGHSGASSTFTVAAPPPLTITTTSPLNLGTMDAAFSQTLAATGGSGAYAWSVSGGALPGGLTLSSGGVLSGTPTAAGIFNFTAQVTDSASNTATQSYAITIAAPSNLTITTTSPLTAGTLGTGYSQTLSASGGTAPYTWALSGGTLPGGLTLSSGGVLSGTPTAAGTFAFNAQISDSATGVATKAFALEIFLSTAANGIGIPHPADTTTYATTDPTSGATVQVPVGMVYVPSGSFTYGPSTTTPVVAATTVTLNGYCLGRFHVTNAEFLAFITDTGYTQYIPSTGVSPTAYWVGGTYPAGKGNHPVNFVSLSAAKAYAAWVSRKTAWNVIIPTAYQIEKAARGPNSYKYPWGNSPGATYSNGVLTANFNFNANVTSYYLTTLNTPYSLTPSWTSASTVTFNNSSSPYYNNPASSYYPSPMTVSSIVAISNASPPVATPLSVSSTGGVSGFVDHNTNTGFIYTDLFSAINNAGGYTTPVGTYPGGVSGYGAYDMAGNLWNWTSTLFVAANGAEASATVNEVRGGSWYATATSAVGVDSGEGRADGDYNSVGFRIAMILPTTANNLSVATASPIYGVINTAFSQTLAATGDTAPYNWSVSSGALPAGLSLDPSGALSGTPTALGTSSFTVQVTGSGGQATTGAVSVIIVNPLAVASASTLPGGTAGTAYSQSLAVTGGAASYVWSVSSGALPGGMTFSGGGVLSGTPTASGTFSFTAQVTDASGQVASQAFSITVASAFSTWAAGFGLTGANAGAGASYTGDGIANLLKFAFGANPTVSGIATIAVNNGTLTTHGAPVVQLNAGGNLAVFGRLDNYAAAGINYTVQFTADFSTWADSTATPNILADDGQIQAVSVPFPATVNGQPARFFRVSVTAP